MINTVKCNVLLDSFTLKMQTSVLVMVTLTSLSCIHEQEVNGLWFKSARAVYDSKLKLTAGITPKTPVDGSSPAPPNDRLLLWR